MATRHNTASNPALAVSDTGWGGEAAPARTAVTGFDRGFAARYTSGTFLRTATGGVTAGLDYTLSVYVRPANGFSSGGNIYIEWRDAGASVITYSSGSYSLTANTVTRASLTGTAPSGAATAQLILDGANYSVTTVDATMLLVEQASTLLDYFDGDSPGASWDGTPGESPSTLPDALPITGALAAVLPSLAGSATALVEASGTLAGTLPPMAATVQATAKASGSLTAALPTLTGVLAGQVAAPPQGALATTLPALRASLTGVSDVPDLDSPVDVAPPRLGWPVGVPRLADLVGPPRLGGA
ncbi:hypothetical protein [Nonomuraea rhodomycinica]|uniref:Uncharacterized protein n=1 Tax=Nonomuraea rhodomycinica TaxID=1712872 RepID=A0A7Y6IWN6_9ACTN|nr:hypothetical protein [Nonomuraea rhodomycinica]NUW45555.1 hypothetical protein [Nonomuraea rhodomycinica]